MKKMMNPAVSARCTRFARLATAAAALGVLSLTTGCVAIAAAGAAGTAVAWIRGALETNLDRDLDRVYRATQQAMRDLEFAVISEGKTSIDAQVVARTALDKKIEIQLKQAGSGTTHLSIRVGLLGDQQLSLAILDRIKERL